MKFFSLFSASNFVISLLLLNRYSTIAEPVQFCKRGNEDRSNAAIDFCMGVSMLKNLTSNTHDLYLTIAHTRRNGSALGWTAIGPGSVMAGALMFIIYGDPMEIGPPIVSIRSVPGHAQPTLLTPSDMGVADLRVRHAAWVPSTEPSTSDMPDYVAKISIVCYSCTAWPGTEIAAYSKSQPWIWAWNEIQDFTAYTYDAHLDMHRHHAGAGGWGNFYLDMERSIGMGPNAPSFPPIRPHATNVGASETIGAPPSILGNLCALPVPRPEWHMHGILMAMAFALLAPAGVIAMRSGSARAFRYHWIIQLSASTCVFLGLITGLLLRHGVDTEHQIMGLAVTVSVLAQGVLGWQHHVMFVRTHRRNWISNAHVWLGRGILVCSSSNLLTGLLLHGYPRVCVVVVAVVLTVELSGLGIWVWWVTKKKVARVSSIDGTAAWATQQVDYFALHGEDDTDAESIDLKSEEKLASPED